MQIESGYMTTKEAMQTFGLNRVWLFRKDAKIRRFEQVENGRNKVYYNVEDIKQAILARSRIKTTKPNDDNQEKTGT